MSKGSLPETSDGRLLETMYTSIGVRPHGIWADPTLARIEVHANRILGVHLVPGLEVETLMSRGLDEDQAVDLVVQGLLSR
jgi:hypothetical protein